MSSDAAVRPGEFFPLKTLDPSVSVWRLWVGGRELTAMRALPAASDREPRGVALLLPGFTGSKEDFEYVVPALARLGWEAWGLTHRGQADSDNAPRYDLADFASDAVEAARIIARFERAGTAPRPHLLGHSFGGVVAGDAALLGGADVFASVTFLCSGPHGWDGRMGDRGDPFEADPSSTIWTIEHATPEAADAVAAANPHEAFRRERARQEDRDCIRGMARILEGHPDRGAALAAMGLPVLVAHGDTDDAWPVDMQRDWAHRMGARYEVIAGAGHLPNLEQPAATAALLDEFWAARAR